MQKAAVLFLIFMVLSSSGWANPGGHEWLGTWEGTIEIPDQPLDVVVRLAEADDAWEGEMDIPLQGAFGIPLEEVQATPETLRFSLTGIPGDPSVSVEWDGAAGYASGSFSQSGMEFPMRLVPEERTTEAAAKEARSREEILTDLRAFVEEMLAAWDVPGAAVGIVYQGDVLMAEGFGLRSVEDELPVTGDTVFAIGSSTKAFTTASVALMVDEGRLQWDKPVLDYLPWFRLQNHDAMHQANLRDMALHRTGLARHDFAWYGREIPREEHVRNMAHLEFAMEFRQQYLYNNYGYTVLGYLAGHAAETDWENLVQRRLLDPLSMQRTSFTVQDLVEEENAARPYVLRQGTIDPMAYRELTTMGPAGSINSSAEDMLAWLSLFLERGQVSGEQILSPLSVHQLTLPQLALPTAGYPEIRFSNYALGWMVDDYRGDRMVHHGGNIDGFSALASMLPDENLGVVVLTNLNGSPLPSIVTYRIIDELTERTPVDWNARLRHQVDLMPEDLVQPPRQIEGTTPARSLHEFAGHYEHPAYGRVVVSYDESTDSLYMLWRGEDVTLDHWHYDVFAARFAEIAVEGQFPVHFITGVDGHVQGLEIPFDASVKPIHFAVTADPEAFAIETLERYTGNYEVMGTLLHIRLRDDTLVMEIGGQGAVQLLPERGTRFSIQDMPGGAVEFVLENEKATSLLLTQPNGTFEALRVDE